MAGQHDGGRPGRAAAPAAHHAGVVVCLAGTVPRGSRPQAHASALHAFATREGPPLGRVGSAPCGCGLAVPGGPCHLPAAAVTPVPISSRARDRRRPARLGRARRGPRRRRRRDRAGNTIGPARAAVAARDAGVPVALATRTGPGRSGALSLSRRRALWRRPDRPSRRLTRSRLGSPGARPRGGSCRRRAASLPARAVQRLTGAPGRCAPHPGGYPFGCLLTRGGSRRCRCRSRPASRT